MVDVPAASFLPEWGRVGNVTQPLLRCESGWDESCTEAFLKHEFTNLWLTFQADQTMHIPPLGAKALCVKRLHMVGSGVVSGLEQFRNVEILSMSSYPKNGMDFTIFPKLRDIDSIWDKKHIDAIFACSQLRGLDIDEGFAEEDCRRYSTLPGLTYVGFTGGRLRTLRGLEHCSNLESFGIAYARNFTDLGDLTQFDKLSTLSLTGLPKLGSTLQWQAMHALREVYLQSLPTLSGTIDLAGLNLMEEIDVVNCGDVVLNLSGIAAMPNLRRVWSNAPHTELDVEALFSLPKLKRVGLNASGGLAASDEALLELLARLGRKVSKFERTGSKKNPYVRIHFL